MRSAVYFLCSLLLLTLFLATEAAYAQKVGRDERISQLSPVERDLERVRDQLKDEIRKVETKDENGRSSYVVIPAGVGFGGMTYAVIPRSAFESRLGVNVWIGEMTLEKAAQTTQTTNKLTTAFPATARAELRRVEESLAEVKQELLALLKTPASNGSSNGVATKIDLSGAWNVTAKGNNGKSYTATLRLTKKDDDTYTGSFAWSGSGYSGVENVTGRFDPATRTLSLGGVIAGGNLVPGNYRIEVAANGRRMENGTWTGSDGGGRWNAGK